jgi:hypothetical protein
MMIKWIIEQELKVLLDLVGQEDPQELMELMDLMRPRAHLVQLALIK